MKFLTIITLIIIIAVSNLHSSTTDWVKALHATFPDETTGLSVTDQAYNITKDEAGNIYITGYYEGRAKFGNTTILSNGSRDIFVAKLDADGNWLWVSSAGGISDEYGRDVAVDADGNVFVTGYFNQTAYFGTNEIQSSGNSDIFIAKLDDEGNWLWAASAGGGGYDRGNGITCDDDGNVYVIGNFEGTSSFGSTNLVSSGGRDLFVAKLDADGDWQWAVKGGGAQSESGNSIDFDGTDIVITGIYRATGTFGSISLVAKGNNDILVAKLDTDGDYLWAKGNTAGTSNDEANDIVALPNGSYAITGSFEGTCGFGDESLVSSGSKDIFVAIIDNVGDWVSAYKAGGTLNNIGNGIDIDSDGNYIVSGTIIGTAVFGSTNLISAGNRDIFVAKLSSSGTWTWASKAGGTSGDDSFGVIATDDGIFCTGSYFVTSTFGSDALTSAGGADIFVAKVNTSGTWQWAKSISGLASFADAAGIAEDSKGNKYITGSFYGKIQFGNTPTLTSQGLSDIYVAKLNLYNQWEWAIRAGGTEQVTAADIAVDADDNLYVGGHYWGTITFGSTSVTTSGLTDIFLAKINSSGEWQWLKSGGSSNFDECKAVKVHSDGSIYVSGTHAGRIYFSNNNVNTRGNTDVFIAKINSAGTWQWVRSGGSSGYEDHYSMSLDNNGDILVTGSFENTAYFGTNTIASNGGDDIFVAKLSSSGSWQWASGAGSDSFLERGSGIATDEDGNVYLTGGFRGLATFGSLTKIAVEDSDIFIGKLNSSGTWQWVNSYGSTGYDEGTAIRVYDNKIITAGNYSETVSFGNTALTSEGDRDIYVLELNSDGDIELVKSIGGETNDYITQIYVDKFNRRNFIGNYASNINIGSIEFNETSVLDVNLFLAIYGTEYPPNDWYYAPHFGDVASITIPSAINPEVNGRAIVPGDAIGIFYERNGQYYSSGYNVWTGEDLTIEVWSDNPQTLTKDGYADGETYKYKTWNVLTGEQEFVTVEYESGPDNFTASAESVILEFPFNAMIEFSIALATGWNSISSIVEPEDLWLNSIFSDIVDDIVIVKQGAGIYIPSQGINLIGNWVPTRGYTVFASQATTLVMEGLQINPTQTILNLNSGWQLVAYLRDSEMNAETAFASIASKIVIVKDSAGGIYIPSMGLNLIGNLKPGKAYSIFMTESATFNYPAN